MKILLGSKEHIDSCLAIAKELPQYFTKEALRIMASDFHEQKLYIVIEEHDVVAFCAMKQKNIHVADILWMGVAPNRQGQGIGFALMNYILKELKSSETRLLAVKTLAEEIEYPPYEITRNFYEKMGFIHLETIHQYPEWQSGDPCAIYIRIL